MKEGQKKSGRLERELNTVADSSKSVRSRRLTAEEMLREAERERTRVLVARAKLEAEEIKRIMDQPVTAEELLTAKKSFTDTFPNNFSSPSQVVSLFAGDEMIGRYASQPGYWTKYRDQIEAVDIKAVQRVAKRRLETSKVIVLIVGQKEEILKGHPDHPVKLERITRGGVKELPMRDPFTMKPVK